MHFKKNGEKGLNDALPGVTERLKNIFKEYNPEVDKALFASLMEMYYKDQDPKLIAPELKEWVDKADGDFTKFADKLYKETDRDEEKTTLKELAENPKDYLEEHRRDEANRLWLALNKSYGSNVTTNLNPVQAKINKLQREYMKAQMEVFAEKRFYPDANSTMRVTYGQVKGYKPRDAVEFEHYTDLDGVMEKYVPGDYEFDVPEKLINLYKKKDYGQYGVNGKMPVCFIGTNHTTGGNSGSPALDAYGNLVGLNFDRVWEGTMSDFNYDPTICRNIMVDIRYVLFIVDKYAGATNLIKEMKLVHPKKKPATKKA